ncbi:MAG TPA: DUF3108 domain-containing protein [Chthoniobacteraceae bacterium]|nr:DUF3108 domain-containing protein [Chthoniobacteraceae bacterium]
MRRCLALLAVAAALPALADDWRDELTPLAPGKFPPPRALTANYRFGWGALSAAEAQVDFSGKKKGQLELKLSAKTTGAVRALWRMDAQHTARCSAATLQPISLQQTEQYRRKTEKTKAEFTPDAVVRTQEIEPPEATPPKPKRFEFPNVADLHSALLLVRSQRLREGDRYSLVVFPARTAYLAHIDVLGRERIKAAGQNYDAVKVQISLQHIDKKMQLEPHSKFKSAFAWVSDDKDRLLLKVQAEVFVGSIWMELRSVKFAGE